LGKPDNQKIDIEALKRELRQYFNLRIKSEIDGALDEALFQGSDDSPYEDPAVDTGDGDTGDETKEPSPTIVVKFRNNNNIFTLPTEINSFGNVLISGDGTAAVNVVGRIFDETTGIESYKVRIKRIG
jgi:hypothetical protein